MSDIRPLSVTEFQLRSLFLLGLKGDEAAYRSFLHSLQERMRGFLRRRLSRSSDVEDILQEVLMAVHAARHTYRADQPLTVWTYAIARYKLMDFFRAHARRAAFDSSLDAASEIAETADAESSNAGRDLGLLLDNLPDRYRLPIVHTKLYGFSVTETARLTGLSESAVKIGVHRGIKKLMSSVDSERSGCC